MPTLRVNVIRGSNLIAADFGGSSDPYCLVKIGSETQFASQSKTRVVKKSLNPEWNEFFTLHVNNPQTEKLLIEVKDKDKIGKDDSLGTAQMTLFDLQRGVEKKCWLPLQGGEMGQNIVGGLLGAIGGKKGSVKNNGKVYLGVTALDFGQAGYHQQPHAGAYQQPQAGAYGQSYQQPHAGAYGQSYQQPQAGAYGQSYQQPHAGAYQQPQAGAYGQSYQQPHAGAYQQPQAGAYGQSYQQPQAGAYGQSYQQPQAGAYGQSYQQPQASGYGQSYQQPHGQQPQAGAYGQSYQQPHGSGYAQNPYARGPAQGASNGTEMSINPYMQ